MGYDAYAVCLAEMDATEPSTSQEAELLLRCVSDTVSAHHNRTQAVVEEYHALATDLYMIIAASLVFFMQAGFAMVCAGSVRRKNLQNTMLKNLLDACWASLSFYTVGYAFAYGDGPHLGGLNRLVGTTNFFLHNLNDADLVVWLFQYTFSAAAATIVAGTLAERCKMAAYIAYSIFVSGFVYPVVVHAVWNDHGFLSFNSSVAHRVFGLDVGVIDFAGCGVVHVTGGTVALVATAVLGPRRGRFHDEVTGEKLQTPCKIVGHSVSLQVVGTFILWFCWYGFNAGSALLLTDSRHQTTIAALAAANTTLSAGSAGISALVTNMIVMYYRTGHSMYDLNPTLNGVLSGLVAITGACGVVEPLAAVVVGVVAGWLYLVGSWMLIQCQLDDAVNGIPIHMINGVWGLLAVGLFASPQRIEQAYGAAATVGSRVPSGLVTSIFEAQNRLDGRLLLSQVVAAVFILLWSAVVMYPFFQLLSRQGMFRTLPKEEVLGLDRSMHGGVQDDSMTIQQFTVYQSILQATLDKKREEKRLRRRAARRNSVGDSTTTSSSNAAPTLTSSEIRQAREQAKLIAPDGGDELLYGTNHGSINTITEGEDEANQESVSDIGSTSSSESGKDGGCRKEADAVVRKDEACVGDDAGLHSPSSGFARIDMTGGMVECPSSPGML